MQLAELNQAIQGLADKSHADKIKIFGWWLHVHQSRKSFTGADITKCYAQMHFSAPSSIGAYIKQLVLKKELLKLSTGGYKLEHKIRDRFDSIYGKAEITVKVTGLLAGLADTIPNMAERDYYKEALNCYKHGSLRAAVVMTWNIAFSHLCDHVLAKRLADFNSQWLKTCPGMHKNKTKAITAFDDFNDELKESEVLKICRDAGIITKNIYNIMNTSIVKRNAAAHPNAVIIDSVQADAFISDLIRNVVLRLM